MGIPIGKLDLYTVCPPTHPLHPLAHTPHTAHTAVNAPYTSPHDTPQGAYLHPLTLTPTPTPKQVCGGFDPSRTIPVILGGRPFF